MQNRFIFYRPNALTYKGCIFLPYALIIHLKVDDVHDSCFGAVVVVWGPFWWNDLTLIPAWINNHMPGDNISYPSLNFNGCTVEV